MQLPRLAVLTNREGSLQHDNQIKDADTVAVDVNIPGGIGGMSAIDEVGDGRGDKMENGRVHYKFSSKQVEMIKNEVGILRFFS
ncbi:hypothetical protein D3C87_1885470 [compost metagenome]